MYIPTSAWDLSLSILPLQLVRISTSVLAAIPFEATTMTGRRLRQSVQTSFIRHDQESENTMFQVFLSSLSNAYCGYMTTREEYAIQRYEGASTHFGPN